jgi:hypothetical protein
MCCLLGFRQYRLLFSKLFSERANNNEAILEERRDSSGCQALSTNSDTLEAMEALENILRSVALCLDPDQVTIAVWQRRRRNDWALKHPLLDQ